MQNSKAILIWLFGFLPLLVLGQQDSYPPKRNHYGLVGFISGGNGYYLDNRSSFSYLHPEMSHLSPVTTLRIMWHPDHLLYAGIESGYMNFYSYSFTDSLGNRGKLRLDAIPILAEWSMALSKRFHVFAGTGVYLMHTNLDYMGKTRSAKVSVGWMAATSYIQPLPKRLGLGAEVKWMKAADISNGEITAQLQLVWEILKW
jgi:hypothetical protein